VSSFNIFLDDDNEVRFGVKVEGTEKHEVKCRMMMEANSSMSLFFPGSQVSDGEVQVIIPSLKNVLKEGIYPVRLEVIIDDRIFTPLKMSANVKQSVKVTAEAISRPVRRGPSVSANIIAEEVKEEIPVAVTPVEPQPVPHPVQKRVRETRTNRKQKTLKQTRQKRRQSNVMTNSEFAKLIKLLDD
jgi:hypothetical protein